MRDDASSGPQPVTTEKEVGVLKKQFGGNLKGYFAGALLVLMSSSPLEFRMMEDETLQPPARVENGASIVVVIDCGDTGVVGPTGRTSGEITLGVGLRLRDRLAHEGVVVLLHPGASAGEGPQAPVQMANNAHAKLYVAIAANAAASPSAKGFETYHCANSKNGRMLAFSVHRQLSTMFPAEFDRGVKTGNFTVLKRTTMPAILVAPGFITNPSQEALLVHPETQDRLASALANGIIECLTLMNDPHGVQKPLPHKASAPSQPYANQSDPGAECVRLARQYKGENSFDVKGRMPRFTAAGGVTNNCADFVSSALEEVGLLHGHYINVLRLEEALLLQGYRPVPYTQARPGDVWISASRGHTELVSMPGATFTIGSNNDAPGHQIISERPKAAGTGVVYQRQDVRRSREAG